METIHPNSCRRGRLRRLSAAAPPLVLFLVLIALARFPDPGGRGSDRGEGTPEVSPPPTWTAPDEDRAAALARAPVLALAAEGTAREATVIDDDPRAARLGEALTAALASHRAGLDQRPSPRPAARRPVDPSLAHRSHPLSEVQMRALNRLRLRSPGKVVVWRAAREKAVITLLAGRRLAPAAVRAEAGETRAATTARGFLRANPGLLGAGEGVDVWRISAEQTDGLGYVQVRFAQYWNDLRVWPAGIMLQVAPGGDLTLLTGVYAPEPGHLEAAPSLGVEEAARLAVLEFESTRGLLPRAEAGASELLVYAPLESDARLAWRVEVEASSVERAEVFIDAHSGEPLATVSLVATTAVTGSGSDENNRVQSLGLWRHTDNRFYMIDASKPMFDPTSQPPDLSRTRGVIAVLDQLGAPQPNLAGAVHNVAASADGPWRPDAVSASANLGKVYDYFRARFGRDSADGRGGSMTAVVNMSQANAFADFQSLTLTFGNTDKWAEALDVVAHEMTHSVITTTSQLVYRFQSGALNESFSDILGEGCEAHFNGGVTDWETGSVLRVPGRSLSDPRSKVIGGLDVPYPARMSEFLNLRADQDAGGVHFNSSIINHCFYQLAEGLDGAIGLDDALQIFYRAMTTKLNPNSQFIDARFACVQSAVELFGNGSVEAMKTAEAFDYVELFDQQPTGRPAPIPVVDALDSTLFIFPSGGTTWLGRREAALNDDAAGVFLGDGGQGTPVMPGKKPGVRGDGAFGVYIAPNADGAFINTFSGEETFFGLPGQFDSAAISANGDVQAYVLRNAQGQPDNRIYVFEESTGTTRTWEVNQPLTNPTGTGATANTILHVDALDLTPDGRFIFYDAVNRLTLPGGGFTETWSIYFIDRVAGTVQSLIPPIPGVDVGNPSLAQTRTDLLTFDVVDANGVGLIYVADLTAGRVEPLAVLAAGVPVAPGWPGYSGDDGAVVYTNYTFNPFTGFHDPHLESQPVESDGITARGAAFSWLSGSSPTLGLIFRRGPWAGLPELTVSAPDATASEDAGHSGSFRLSRSGPTSASLPVSFVLTGTAVNGVDTVEIPLTASVALGTDHIDILVEIIDDSLIEGEETLTLTLSENSAYTLGAAASATVAIADNDAFDFAAWAAGFGIGATDFLGDPDHDGRVNLIEYALGSHPRGRNTVPEPRVIVQDGRVVFDVARALRAPDIAYSIEVSDSLGPGTWISDLGQIPATVLEDSALRLRIRLDMPVDSALRRYLRLRVRKL